LPVGASLDDYRSAGAGSDLGRAFNDARSAAGPQVLQTTMIIPVFLILAFAGLVLYMRNRKNKRGLEAVPA
jgi:uncharacterized membrane protein